MKTALIRLLTIATLASSLSAFAATDESKHDSATNASANVQQAGCADNATESKKHKKATKPQRNDNDQDDQNYVRALLAIYG